MRRVVSLYLPTLLIDRIRQRISEPPPRPRGRRAVILATAFVVAMFLGLLLILPQKLKTETVDGRHIVIIDGDTIDVRGERIRTLNIGAPESFHSRCELKLALRAKEQLAELLRAGPVEINRESQDHYRRTLATLSVREGDVGSILVRERLALPWQDGREDKESRMKIWCGPLSAL